MSKKEISEQVKKEFQKAAKNMADDILEQPTGCYMLPEIFGPNRQLFRDEVISRVRLESGRNLETIIPVVISLAGDFNKVPQRLTCRLYSNLYYDLPVKDRLPQAYLSRFAQIYQRLITTLTKTVIERDSQTNETESTIDNKQDQQAGASAEAGVGDISGKVSYNYGASVSSAMRERKRKEKVVERQTQETYMPLQDADVVNTLNDLINELADVPLGLYFNHYEEAKKGLGKIIGREDWLKKMIENFKSGCIMAFVDLLLILPRLLLKTFYNMAQMGAKYTPVLKRGVGKKHVRVLFFIHGLNISSPQAELVSTQLDDLVSNQNAAFIIFVRAG